MSEVLAYVAILAVASLFTAAVMAMEALASSVRRWRRVNAMVAEHLAPWRNRMCAIDSVTAALDGSIPKES